MQNALLQPTYLTEELINGKKEVLEHFNPLYAIQWAQGGEDVKLFVKNDENWRQIPYERASQQCVIFFEDDVRFASENNPSEWALI
jgi:hypothetical protein